MLRQAQDMAYEGIRVEVSIALAGMPPTFPKLPPRLLFGVGCIVTLPSVIRLLSTHPCASRNCEQICYFAIIHEINTYMYVINF